MEIETKVFTKRQLAEDIAFLESRAHMCGSFSMGDNVNLRSWGASANELVRCAYTKEHDGTMPHDYSDLGACVRALASLPEHRRCPRVDAKYREGEKHVRGKIGESG